MDFLASLGASFAVWLNVKTTGIIQALNISPKGFYEGLLLKNGRGLLQVSLPKDEIDAPAGTIKPGEKISVEVEADDPRGDPQHPVFRLIRVHGAKARNVTGGRRFSGTIKQLNYALHGKVNGGILDSGDFLQVKPEGARSAGVETGMQVEGRGAAKPMVGGGSVIEAQEVKGIAIHHHKATKKHGPKHAHRR